MAEITLTGFIVFDYRGRTCKAPTILEVTRLLGQQWSCDLTVKYEGKIYTARFNVPAVPAERKAEQGEALYRGIVTALKSWSGPWPSVRKVQVNLSV